MTRHSARRLAFAALLLAVAAGYVVAGLALWHTSVPGDLRLPPLDPALLFGEHALARSASYERFLRVDELLALVVLLVALALYAARGERLARESAAGRIGTGLLLAMLGFAVVWIVALPFDLAALWWQRRHGIVSEDYLTRVIGSWWALGGEFLFVSFALAIVMGLARPLRQWWWVAGAPIFGGLAVLFAFLWPLAMPDATRPRSAALNDDVRQLARAEGVDDVEVRVAPVRDFTTAPNAEAAGFGPTKRVILWDTLLDGRFPRRELRVVIAHELGHLQRHHVQKLLALYALLAFPGAFLIERATRRRGGMYAARAVPLALFVFVALQLLALPLQASLARRLEAEADWVALQTTRDPNGAAGLFRRFTTTTLEHPDPPAWFQKVLGTHPTVMERTAMARAWQARAIAR